MCLMCGQCVSPHCRRISEKLILSPLCAALRLDVTRRLVYCAVLCTVPRAACTVLRCTVLCHLPRLPGLLQPRPRLRK